MCFFLNQTLCLFNQFSEFSSRLLVRIAKTNVAAGAGAGAGEYDINPSIYCSNMAEENFTIYRHVLIGQHANSVLLRNQLHFYHGLRLLRATTNLFRTQQFAFSSYKKPCGTRTSIFYACSEAKLLLCHCLALVAKGHHSW